MSTNKGSVVDPVKFPQTAAAFQWVDDVVAGRVIACRWVRLACERHKRDLARSLNDPSWSYKFDPAKSEKALKFISLLPHTKGKWAAKRQLIQLESWQKFFVASVFGWVHKITGFRRFRVADLFVPRKNGKSILAAAIGLYMLTADGEFGAEVYSGATTQKQAWEVFKPARLMALRTPKFRRHYKLDVAAGKLERADTGSLFEPVIGKPGDGASPSCSIVDEYHEHADDALYDTMLTGMGARDQPLMLVITTAGDDIAGPCYAHLEELKNVLEGTVEDDSLFGLLFTIDEVDDWTTLEALQKANPNFGVSINPDFLNRAQIKARGNARHQNSFKTKHLNLWVSARTAYYNMDTWKQQTSKAISLLPTDEKFGAVDLASKIDITAYVSIYRRLINGIHHYFVVEPKFYLPEATAEEPDKKHYHAWMDSGHLLATEGNIIDFRTIQEDLIADHNNHRLESLGYDPWGATQFAQDLQDDHGMTVIKIDQRTANLSEPMKWVDALLRAGRLHHDGNPVLTWMISNVVAKADANDNVFPRKPSDEKKIDGAVALIMALGLAMAGDRDEGSYLEDEDLMVL